ncbi:MAG: hypothetical protein KF705_13860 [Phycisphaeraceae bacterium]|nr:hypothetical protein [Phycisphaeraceae bacterium]
MPERVDPTGGPANPSGDAARLGAEGVRGADQVDELDLLGWVEGDLPRGRQGAVEALLAREPRLRELLEAMSADREVVRSLGPVSAPPDLLSRVEQQLERDLLVGLSGPSSDSLSIPVSRVVVKGDGILARLSRGPALRYGAMAAMLVIAGTVGILLRPSLVSREVYTSGAQPPMLHVPNELASVLGADVSESVDAVAAGRIASEQPPSLTDLAIARADLAESLAPADELVTPERAVELLREGRLAIRVRTLDRERTFERLASIHAEPRATWALLDRAGEGVVAAFVPRAGPEGSRIDPRVLASEGVRGSGSRPAIVIPAAPTPDAPAVYIAEVDETARALATLRGVLGTGSNQVAEFVALEERVATPAPASVESLLWWTRPPSGWVERRTLPVVVEGVSRR